jgi:hypothetical protein
MSNFSHVHGVTYRTDAGQLAAVTTTLTSNTDIAQDITVAATTTNYEADIDVTEANIQSMAIYSDKAVTVKTNSTSAPDDTITLTAGQMKIWKVGDLDAAKLFTADVTKLYITNAGSAIATVKVRILLDQTPA